MACLRMFPKKDTFHTDYSNVGVLLCLRTVEFNFSRQPKQTNNLQKTPMLRGITEAVQYSQRDVPVCIPRGRVGAILCRGKRTGLSAVARGGDRLSKFKKSGTRQDEAEKRPSGATGAAARILPKPGCDPSPDEGTMAAERMGGRRPRFGKQCWGDAGRRSSENGKLEMQNSSVRIYESELVFSPRVFHHPP
ncbi:uncharacterized protein VTP21DRAFT_2933 [Calcarisporiella thermophila]|uniref:uncharacterized protein n=1 Tax=Calcarisporiella thermophila TaxID=911321 RepID=UPI0037442F82